jgi:hypothetical protein
MKKKILLPAALSVATVAAFLACSDTSSSLNLSGISSASADPGTSSATVVDPTQSSAATATSSATVINPTQSSASTGTSSAAVIDPTQSSAATATSSAAVVTSSSAGTTITSSTSAGSDISTYPVAAYSSLLASGGSGTGWSSRYWDACKPSCSWPGNVDTTSEATYQAGYRTTRNCNIHDIEIPTYTLAKAVQQYWIGYQGTNSACGSGSAGAFACTDMAPIEVNDTLSYGYVAGPGSTSAGACGKCYHIQFNGGNHANDIKATHKALKGKHMIVMQSNIGYDVEQGQFDLMVPGGGVGQYDALSTMVNGSSVTWGAKYGGFLTQCQSSLGYDNTVANYQSCVKDMCAAAFTGYPNLLRGCNWYADWYMAADNPTYNWEEVQCPQYLIDKYMSTINTTKTNHIIWKDDWSTYTGGALDTNSNCTATGCN